MTKAGLSLPLTVPATTAMASPPLFSWGRRVSHFSKWAKLDDTEAKTERNTKTKNISIAV